MKLTDDLRAYIQEHKTFHDEVLPEMERSGCGEDAAEQQARLRGLARDLVYGLSLSPQSSNADIAAAILALKEEAKEGVRSCLEAADLRVALEKAARFLETHPANNDRGEAAKAEAAAKRVGGDRTGPQREGEDERPPEDVLTWMPDYIALSYREIAAAVNCGKSTPGDMKADPEKHNVAGKPFIREYKGKTYVLRVWYEANRKHRNDTVK